MQAPPGRKRYAALALSSVLAFSAPVSVSAQSLQPTNQPTNHPLTGP